MPNVIETHELTKIYDRQMAVNKISIKISSGEIYGFLGPNGAGKSTTIGILTTILKPTSGSATVLGLDINKDIKKIRLKIGAALQDVGLDLKQTGRELLNMVGCLYGLNKTERKKRIAEIEDLIDIGKAIDKLIETYSGGMKRKLDLALALIYQPPLLFLDEPTTGLDPRSRLAVWEQLKNINQKYGTTIFLTTQYLEEADYLAHRVGIINEGSIIAEDTPSELKKQISSDIITVKVTENYIPKAKETLDLLDGLEKITTYQDYLYLYIKNSNQILPEVVRLLNDAEIEIRELSSRAPTLDDVFLKLTGTNIQSEAGKI